MPELPEMTAYCRRIADAFEGAKLVESQFVPRCKIDAPHEEVADAIQGARLLEVERNGKELFLRFDSEDTLALHLMLGGRFNIAASEDEPPAGRRASFVFDNGQTLHMRDSSGWAKISFNPDPPTVPDALSPDLDFEYLKERFTRAPRSLLKAFLTDQERIRGIGNAYSDEILWAARIAPQSRAGKLPDNVIEDLASAIKDVLSEAVEIVCALDNPSDYRKARLRDLKVHNHTRDQSPGGAEIKTGKVANAKTYFTDEQVLYE